MLAKGARACLACAASRTKCSGDAPCSTCERRSFECEYPAADKSRRDKSTSTPEEVSNGSGAEYGVASPHESIMSWSNASQSPATAKGPNLGSLPVIGDQVGGSDYTLNARSGSENRYNGRSGQNGHLFDSTISPTPAQLQIRESRSPMNISALICEDQSVFSAKNLPLPSSPNFQNTAGSQTSNAQNDYHGPTQATEPWYQNGFSSINWLSDAWTTDFSIENRDAGIELFDQRSSHILENARGIGASSFAMTSDNAMFEERSSSHSYPPPLGNQGVDRSQSTPSAGHFYIDGDGARLPRVRKPPYTTEAFTPTPHYESAMRGDGFVFPEVSEPLENATPNVAELPDTTYNEILRVFKRTCTISTHYSQFARGSFPPIGIFSQLVFLYVDNFQPILPFLHYPSLDLSTMHWLLVLALASIGSHYMESEDNDIFIVAMHELTRRAIQTVVSSGFWPLHRLHEVLTIFCEQTEADDDAKSNSLVLIQAKLLNFIGISYSGDMRLQKFDSAYKSDFVSFCTNQWALPRAQTNTDVPSNLTTASNNWKIWHEEESHRRTGYCIWVR